MGGAVAAQHSTGGKSHNRNAIGDTQLVFSETQQPDGPLHIGQRIIAAVWLQAIGKDSGIEAGLGEKLGCMEALAAGPGGEAAAVGHNHSTPGVLLPGCRYKNERGLGLQRVPAVVAGSAVFPQKHLVKTGEGIVPDFQISGNIHRPVRVAVLGNMADNAALGANGIQRNGILFVHKNPPSVVTGAWAQSRRISLRESSQRQT